MTDYPDTLPVPQVADYQVSLTTGISRVVFEHGNTRQRRSARKERRTFSLSLVLTTAQLWEWQSWANQYGYDWHYLDLTSDYAGFTTGRTLPHYIRYTGDVSIQSLGGGYVKVLFQAEMDLNTVPLGILTPTGDVIIGGTPASPNSSNSVQAGTPASPSTDIIIAGTPGLTA